MYQLFKSLHDVVLVQELEKNSPEMHVLGTAFGTGSEYLVRVESIASWRPTYKLYADIHVSHRTFASFPGANSLFSLTESRPSWGLSNFSIVEYLDVVE